MIIPKKYGGLELNHHEQSQIVQKISTASNPLGVMIMVQIHWDQPNYYLNMEVKKTKKNI